MIARSLLRLSREQVLADWPDLIVHDEPEEIQDGDTRAYASHAGGEFEIVFDAEDRVSSVFVYRQSSLLDGIVSFSATRVEILRSFGSPAASGQEQVIKFLGPQGAWDCFDFRDWVLHFQYVPGGNEIRQVTVMTLDVAKRIRGVAGE